MDNLSVSLKLVPPNAKKRRVEVGVDNCIICNSVDDENLITSTESGRKSLINAAAKRRDDLFSFFDEFCNEISSKLPVFRYHRSCFKSYTSKHNLKAVACSSAEKETPDINYDFSNSLVPGNYDHPLDTSKCIICRKMSHKRVKTLHTISSAERLANLKDAAIRACDAEMIDRIEKENLLNKAVYHAACLTTYLAYRPKSNDKSAYDLAFERVVEIIDRDLICDKKSLLLSSLLTMYQSFLPDKISKTYCNSSKLKAKLEKHYKDAIVFFAQQGQGKSSIVFASDISIGDAVKAANSIKAELELLEIKADLSTCSSTKTNEQTDMHVLYAAASILRQKMENVYISGDYYPANDEASLEMSEAMLPTSLISFITWLLDKKSFETFSSVSMDISHDIRRKCAALAECLVSNCSNIITPFSLGLAVQLYHEFGSKSLIENLNAHGFCVKYDEVRRFLTSVANAEITKIQGGCYVPSGIANCGSLIQEGVDNIDINTETIDGKNTFHSMARAIFQNSVLHGTFGFNTRQRFERKQDKALVYDEKVSSLMQCLPFTKPKMRGEPLRRQNALELLNSCTDPIGQTPDLLWVIRRMICREGSVLPHELSSNCTEQFVPFWSGFFSTLADFKPDRTIVAYGPIIDNKPSDMATVFTAMHNCQNLATTLGQKHAIQTMDQQLYAVAQQVKWSLKDKFADHIIRLGGFHALSCFIAAVGKLWSEAGLKDLLVDSGVYAGTTAEQMLSGKQFNRAVRGLTLVYEALMHVLLSQFFQYCDLEDRLADVPKHLWSRMKEANLQFESSACSGNSQPVDNLAETFTQYVTPVLTEYIGSASEKSPTFKYWLMLLHAIQLILHNIKAEREGNWQLHLYTISKMLPYFFITNRTNYSRWAPVYLLDMLELPPEVQQHFDNGEFTIRQVSGRYNGIWSDMAVEKTVIKDSKGSGGIANIAGQKSALIRWSLSRHVVADFASTMRVRSGIKSEADHMHGQTQKAAMKRDEEHVRTLINHLTERMTNPFDISLHPECLINISTGMHVSPEIQKSLLTAIETGDKNLRSFVNNAFSTDGKSSFYSPLSRSNLKTFADMSKKTPFRSRTGDTLHIHVDPELVFRRALTLSSSRDDVSLQKIMEHPIGPVPTSIFHDDGSMRKSVKAELLHKLEETASSVPVLPDFDKSKTVFIRDGMAIVQTFHVKKSSTFGDLANDYVARALSNYHQSETVIDVFDRYDVLLSVKSSERERRSSKTGYSGLYQVIESRLVPDWKRFLSVSQNKKSFLHFLGEYVTSNVNTKFDLPFPNALYMAGCFTDPEIAKKLTHSSVISCPTLRCNHEEADTRMIFHAFHADEMFVGKDVKGRIVIKSDDTDVLVLAVHFYPMLKNTKELWVQTGSIGSLKDNRRFIPVHDIVSSIDPVVTGILPVVHALSGCDSTSSFFGIGKKSVFNLLRLKPSRFSNLVALTQDDVDSAVVAAREFVAALYDSKYKFKKCHNDLNLLRHQLAINKDKSLIKLPPCESVFKQHVLRAIWQSKVWVSANLANPNNGSPCAFGWKTAQNDKLEPVFFEGQMASDFLQDLICSCKGKKACQEACVCKEQGLPCTDLCFCQNVGNCNNVQSVSADIADDTDEIS